MLSGWWFYFKENINFPENKGNAEKKAHRVIDSEVAYIDFFVFIDVEVKHTHNKHTHTKPPPPTHKSLL